ncbi:bile acid:sodium symporter family protein [Neoroseomonas lacus]|uniref:Bile acid:sodium symporter family protein n=1 Tax=Neoroseomonas lacus TaxID=287609 RepID=A0A917L443_9PROT|nr:hypothetical protein [Neoroseomonas lacus]GGJ43501.1 hypothetical protein GCM10011320_58770 [Neoroseomonas lacus]
MSDLPLLALKLSLLVFMAGSLMEMGLGLRLRDALSGLRDRRFLLYGAGFGFVIGPGLAWGMAQVLPLSPPHALGLMLLGLTPCAPFVPIMVNRAQGDVAYVPAMMLLAALGTVTLMPVAVPLLAASLSVDAWAIARPLLVMVLTPLVLGMAVFHLAPHVAAVVRPRVKAMAAVAAVALLVLCGVLFGHGFLASFGSFAIGSQVLYLAIITTMGYRFSRGVGQQRRSGLGLCTRNVGAAMAPLLSAPGVDDGVIVMLALAVPVQIACGLAAAWWFGRDAQRTAAEGETACPSG